MDPSLRERLSAVSRARVRRPEAAAPAVGPGATADAEAASAAGAPHPVPTEATPVPASPGRSGAARRGRIPPLDKILPGRELTLASGRCWLHERPLAGWSGVDPGLEARLAGLLAAEPPADMAEDPALRALRASGPGGGFYLDLETTGLAGMPVFLAGVLAPGPLPGTPTEPDDPPGMRFRLYLARDYREEAPLLEALAAEFSAWPTVITYNGKSYDLPYLRERAARLRVRLPAAAAHLDLLHPARRRWSGRLPDCRLTTLEWHLCGRRRVGDIPGSEIPAAYHRWVQERDPRPLLPVFRHNIVDLYTLAEVTGRVLEEPWPLPGAPSA